MSEISVELPSLKATELFATAVAKGIRASRICPPLTIALTGTWWAQLGRDGFALAGAGLWPLLALLASAADEQARAELVTALGRPAESAQQDALELIDVLRAGVSTTAALGLWTRKDIPLHAEWASGLPEGVVRTLTDQAALDQWASEETGGLIEKFPLTITPATVKGRPARTAARTPAGQLRILSLFLAK